MNPDIFYTPVVTRSLHSNIRLRNDYIHRLSWPRWAPTQNDEVIFKGFLYLSFLHSDLMSTANLDLVKIISKAINGFFKIRAW